MVKFGAAIEAIVAAGKVVMYCGIVLAGLEAGVGGVYLIASAINDLFSNQAIHVESTQKYVFNTYEGDYGVLSQIYSRPWYFMNGYLANETDDIVYYETKVVPTEGESRTENVPYMYISKSRPNDVNASITIGDDYRSNSSIAELKLTLNTGDTMQKYCYYNGQYYINLFALKTTKTYISGLELPSDIESQPYILKNNGLIYVGEGVNITQDGVTIDSNKVSTSEFTTKELYFSYHQNGDDA